LLTTSLLLFAISVEIVASVAARLPPRLVLSYLSPLFALLKHRVDFLICLMFYFSSFILILLFLLPSTALSHISCMLQRARMACAVSEQRHDSMRQRAALDATRVTRYAVIYLCHAITHVAFIAMLMLYASVAMRICFMRNRHCYAPVFADALSLPFSCHCRATP